MSSPSSRTVQGSIAGATGIALLLGGFGTYALWSDSADLGSSAVTSGELDIALGPALWTDQDGAAWTAGDRMVPGDTVARVQEFTFVRSGKNLSGTIRVAGGDVTEPTTGTGDDFTVGVRVDGYAMVPGSAGCWEFTSSDVPATFTTSVTYTLTADDTDLQNVTASMAESQVVVEQGDGC